MTAERWVLNPQLVLHWRQIDGEWLLYDDLSGATHMIDYLSAVVLTCFESRVPQDMNDLIAQLATDLALDVTAALAAAVVQQFLALDMLLPEIRAASVHAAA